MTVKTNTSLYIDLVAILKYNNDAQHIVTHYRGVEINKYLLGGKGQFYKANLHCHTDLSDGFLTPEEVKALYKAHGYSIVAFTDHDILIPHKDLKDDSFLPLNGLEFTLVSPAEEAGVPGKHPTIHLCMIGLEEDNVTMPLY